MPKITHRPQPNQAQPLAAYLAEFINEKQVSLRTAAKNIGIDVALLSRILNGQHTPSAKVCNLIADYLSVSRVQVYAMSGWFEMDDPNDRELLEALRSSIPASEFVDIEQVYFNIGDQAARERFIQLVQRLSAETAHGAAPGS